MRSWLLRRWYSSRPVPWFLRPLAVLYRLVTAFRRRRQQTQAAQQRPAVPVLVVGNIAVGGTGKTPFVIWLVERLREWGWSPGIVSRGYGGRAAHWPRRVTAESDPAEVGDEPVLMAQRTGCPVVVSPDRVEAVRELTASGAVDIVVSDDGLQHYRLWRDAEIAVVDGSRGLGNGQLLPAGPLRELPARLQEVGLVVVNGSGWQGPAGRSVQMRLYSMELRSLQGESVRPISDFAGQTVHAVAGIGNPARFFSMLSRHDLRLVMHPFPDHHPYRKQDLAFGDDLPVLMTEKDAVKCGAFAGERCWVVPVDVSIDAAGTALVQELVRKLKPRRKSE